MSNIQTINFNNQQLLTVEKDGTKYVAVKPIYKEFKQYLLRGEWFDPSLNVADVILFLESQKYVLESDFELGFGSKLIEAFKNR